MSKRARRSPQVPWCHDMAGQGGLSAKQLRAAQALSEGQTRTEAAANAGVSPRTVYRYQHSAEFRQTVTILTEQRLNAVRGALAAAGRRSVDTLDGIAQDEDAPTSQRIAAARAILQTLATVERADHQRRQDESIHPDQIEAIVDKVGKVVVSHVDAETRKLIVSELDEIVENGTG